LVRIFPLFSFANLEISIYISNDSLHDLLLLLVSGEQTTPSNVAFGTTVLNRPTFPTDIAHDCFGNHQTPLRGVPDL